MMVAHPFNFSDRKKVASGSDDDETNWSDVGLETTKTVG